MTIEPLSKKISSKLISLKTVFGKIAGYISVADSDLEIREGGGFFVCVYLPASLPSAFIFFTWAPPIDPPLQILAAEKSRLSRGDSISYFFTFAELTGTLFLLLIRRVS